MLELLGAVRDPRMLTTFQICKRLGYRARKPNDYLTGFVHYSAGRGRMRWSTPLSSKTELDRDAGSRTVRELLYDFLVKHANRFGHGIASWSGRAATPRARRKAIVGGGENRLPEQPQPQSAEDECDEDSMIFNMFVLCE